ncbi:MAG: hypothetical protein NT033_07595 [Candidatus Omnitrophica bacterium]|nr:hypothetical protein [Candidatus Omnitrophota bacterium]
MYFAEEIVARQKSTETWSAFYVGDMIIVNRPRFSSLADQALEIINQKGDPQEGKFAQSMRALLKEAFGSMDKKSIGEQLLEIAITHELVHVADHLRPDRAFTDADVKAVFDQISELWKLSGSEKEDLLRAVKSELIAYTGELLVISNLRYGLHQIFNNDYSYFNGPEGQWEQMPRVASGWSALLFIRYLATRFNIPVEQGEDNDSRLLRAITAHADKEIRAAIGDLYEKLTGEKTPPIELRTVSPATKKKAASEQGVAPELRFAYIDSVVVPGGRSTTATVSAAISLVAILEAGEINAQDPGVQGQIIFGLLADASTQEHSLAMEICQRLSRQQLKELTGRISQLSINGKEKIEIVLWALQLIRHVLGNDAGDLKSILSQKAREDSADLLNTATEFDVSRAKSGQEADYKRAFRSVPRIKEFLISETSLSGAIGDKVLEEASNILRAVVASVVEEGSISSAQQPGSLFFSFEEWQNGRRPEGYISTSELIGALETAGISWDRHIKSNMLQEWRELLRNLRERGGLTREESDRLADISREIAYRLTIALGRQEAVKIETPAGFRVGDRIVSLGEGGDNHIVRIITGKSMVTGILDFVVMREFGKLKPASLSSVGLFREIKSGAASVFRCNDKSRGWLDFNVRAITSPEVIQEINRKTRDSDQIYLAGIIDREGRIVSLENINFSRINDIEGQLRLGELFPILIAVQLPGGNVSSYRFVNISRPGFEARNLPSCLTIQTLVTSIVTANQAVQAKRASSASALKNIVDGYEELAPGEEDTLLKYAAKRLQETRPPQMQIEGKIVKRIDYDNEDAAGMLLLSKGVAGAFNIADQDGITVYLFLQKDPIDLDKEFAIEHELLEIQWKARLKGKSSEELFGFTIEKAAHILAWGIQINRFSAANINTPKARFVKVQFDLIDDVGQLRLLLQEDRSQHAKLRRKVFADWPNVNCDFIETFEKSVNSYLDERIKILQAKESESLAFGKTDFSSLEFSLAKKYRSRLWYGEENQTERLKESDTVFATLVAGGQGKVLPSQGASFSNYIVIVNNENRNSVLIHTSNFVSRGLARRALERALQMAGVQNVTGARAFIVRSPSDGDSAKIEALYQDVIDNELKIPRVESSVDRRWGDESRVRFLVDEAMFVALSNSREAITLAVELNTRSLINVASPIEKGAPAMGLSAGNPADSAGAPTNTGGINFTALPIATESIVSPGAQSNIPKPSTLNINLDKEWQEIQKMLQGEIIPSSQRLKEYLIVSCTSDDCQEQVDKILSCIVDILRLEEERCCDTDAKLRQILSLLESDKPVNELQLALSKLG